MKLALVTLSLLAVLPAPLSQQDRDRLREIGRQNAIKYGNGPTVTPTLVPTLVPTETPKPLDFVPVRTQSFWEKVRSFVLSLFRKNTQIALPVVVLTPTIVQNTKLAEQYWEEGFAEWQRIKDDKKAGALYKKALEVDPNYAPALASYGYLRGEFWGEYEFGVKDLQRAMKIDPEWAYAPYNLALLQHLHASRTKNKELDNEALRLFRFTLKKFSKHPDWSWFNEHYQAALLNHKEIFGE